MPVTHFDESWDGIVLPVGDTVTNHHTLEVWFEIIAVLVELVMLVNLVDQIWYVDTSIRFS